MMMLASRLKSLIAVLGLVCSSAPALAQPVQAPRHISASERADVLKAVKAKFQELYVFPDMRPKIVEKLDRMQASGRYDVEDPELLAERITEDLRDVSHDHHLSIRVDPQAYAAAVAPAAGDAGEEAFARREAIRTHHGLAEMKILPGNIRYLKINKFEWVSDETGAVYDDAMRFLKDGDAIIIDIRGVPGGSHPAVRYLISHFLDPGTLEFTFLEGSQAPEQSRALDYVPAGRLKGKPLYVLIDNRVGSAAEAFAYDVEQFKLGELVGAKTVGAANNNKLLPIAPMFILSVSFGRPEHAISHTNWEGVGVRPTLDVPPSQALDVAQASALKRLADTPGAASDALVEYAWARTAVEARLHPVTLTSAQLKAWVGSYGKANVGYGNVDVRLRDGALWMERSGRPPAHLVPMTADGLFAIEGNELLRVRLTGKALETLWWNDPNPRVFARD